MIPRHGPSTGHAHCELPLNKKNLDTYKMAFRKTGYRKTYKRKTFKKKGATSVAYRALRLARAVSARTRPEVKKHDFVWQGAAITQAGLIYDLTNTIGLGDSFTSRNGRKIKLTRLSGKLLIEMPSTANALVRIIIFRGIKNDGNPFWIQQDDRPTTSYIPLLQPDTADKTIIAHKHNDYTRSSKIIYDKVFNFSAGTVTRRFMKYNMKLWGNCEYPTTYNADAEHRSTKNGGLYFAIMYSESVTATLSGELRVNFTDV